MATQLVKAQGIQRKEIKISSVVQIIINERALPKPDLPRHKWKLARQTALYEIGKIAKQVTRFPELTPAHLQPLVTNVFSRTDLQIPEPRQGTIETIIT